MLHSASSRCRGRIASVLRSPVSGDYFVNANAFPRAQQTSSQAGGSMPPLGAGCATSMLANASRFENRLNPSDGSVPHGFNLRHFLPEQRESRDDPSISRHRLAGNTGLHRSVPVVSQNPSLLPHSLPSATLMSHSPLSMASSLSPPTSVLMGRQYSSLVSVPQSSPLLRHTVSASSVTTSPVTTSPGTPPLGPAWACAGSPRPFVQLLTMLDVADNSGAKKVMCIKVLKGARTNAAHIGDIIIASVKSADFHGKVKKGEVVTCVVVRSAMAKRRVDGSMVRFDGPAAVVINKAGEPIGTRVFGPVPHELRRKKLVKVLALAQHVA